MRIKDVPTHLKPREKIKTHGSHTLSDQELFCIILGSGSKTADVTILAKKVHDVFQKNQIVTLNQLTNIHGIGLAKATQLLAMFELQKRVAHWKTNQLPLTTAKQVFHRYRHLFLNILREELHVVLLNTQLVPITNEMVFRGTLDSITLHAREIFHAAITHSAHSLIIIHNHPSQNVEPSKEDILFTQQMIQIGEIIGIPVLDHMIFTKNDYWSFAEEKS